MSAPPERIAVALSGGVDSAVAALELQRQGHDLVAVTFHAQAIGPPPERAAAVARQLGLPHVALDLSVIFEREVIAPFAAAYAAGRTPNPCSMCNRGIKFGALLDEAASRLGATALATGHYARRVLRGGRWTIQRARHRGKDQSYALAGLTQAQIAAARFPLGNHDKPSVRAQAQALGLAEQGQRESQDICFIPDGACGQFLETRLGPPVPGPILAQDGRVLGEHKGLIHYTVGQRRGLGIAAPEPYYVVKLDAARNALIVAHRAGTYANRLETCGVNWMGLAPQTAPFRAQVQIRYRHTAAPAVVRPAAEGLEIVFDDPQHAIAPGQWAALYDDDACIQAAGIIA